MLGACVRIEKVFKNEAIQIFSLKYLWKMGLEKGQFIFV